MTHGGNERAGFIISGKINRSDWGLIWNSLLETGGFMVSDEVIISCEIEVIKVNQNELKMGFKTCSRQRSYRVIFSGEHCFWKKLRQSLEKL